MAKLSSEDIERLAKAFDEYHHEKYPDTHPAVEDRLTELLTTQDYLSTDDVAAVIEWKLEGQGGRAERFKRLLRSVPSEYVEYVTKAAFLVDDARQQLKTVNAIPGVGFATATVIMAFNNPADYAVGDRYINEVVLGEENAAVTPSNYEALLDELHARNPGRYDLRTVEKAYYQDYLQRISG